MFGLFGAVWREHMKKVLDLNAHPFLTSYSYYAFPLAIITANSRVDDKIAEFSVCQSTDNEFMTMGKIYLDGERWKVQTDNAYLEGCNACIYRELKEEDLIELETIDQQYTNAWSAINIFVCDSMLDLPDKDEKFIYRFGRFFYNGINLYKKGTPLIDAIQDVGRKIKLSFSYRNGICEFYIIKGKRQWIAEEHLEIEKEKPLYIGIQVKNGDNMFYRWFYQNFIQLSCDLANSDRRLEFHYGIQKDWDQNSFHYFLNQNYICFEDYKKLGGLKYIKKCINRNQYIELEINQRWIKGRDEYLAMNHYHQNLIYGYCDSRRVFYLLGYSNKGKVQSQEIKFRDLKRSIGDQQSILKVITYHQDAYFFEFDRNYVMITLEEYLSGTNSKIHTQHLSPKDNRVYGIKIYEELVKDEGIDLMISDRRIAHVLWEHKKLMIERIEYLEYLKEITWEQRNELIDRFVQIEKLVYNMKNLLLKYQMRPDKTDYRVIRDIINEVRSLETESLLKLLNDWKG